MNIQNKYSALISEDTFDIDEIAETFINKEAANSYNSDNNINNNDNNSTKHVEAFNKVDSRTPLYLPHQSEEHTLGTEMRW